MKYSFEKAENSTVKAKSQLTQKNGMKQYRLHTIKPRVNTISQVSVRATLL